MTLTTTKCRCSHARWQHATEDPCRCTLAMCGCRAFRTTDGDVVAERDSLMTRLEEADATLASIAALHADEFDPDDEDAVALCAACGVVQPCSTRKVLDR